jgi:flagellar hook assembly protein FlgD
VGTTSSYVWVVSSQEASHATRGCWRFSSDPPRLVKRLVDEIAGPGAFTAEWNGTNGNGEHASTGVYFSRIIAGSLVEAKKVVLLK